MIITYTLEPRDLKALAAYNYKHNPSMKRLKYIGIIFFGIYVLINALKVSSDPIHQIVYFLFYSVVIFLLFKIGMYFIQKIGHWRLMTPKHQVGLICQHTIELKDDALDETTSVNHTRHFWTGVYNVVEDKDYIYVYININSAHIIPKRSFSDPESARMFFERAFMLYSNAKNVS